MLYKSGGKQHNTIGIKTANLSQCKRRISRISLIIYHYFFRNVHEITKSTQTQRLKLTARLDNPEKSVTLWFSFNQLFESLMRLENES